MQSSNNVLDFKEKHQGNSLMSCNHSYGCKYAWFNHSHFCLVAHWLSFFVFYLTVGEGHIVAAVAYNLLFVVKYTGLFSLSVVHLFYLPRCEARQVLTSIRDDATRCCFYSRKSSEQAIGNELVCWPVAATFTHVLFCSGNITCLLCFYYVHRS